MSHYVTFAHRGGKALSVDVQTDVLEISEPIEKLRALDLSILPDLRELRLMAPVSTHRSLDFLRGCPNLEALYINAMAGLEDCDGISVCRRLKRLGIGERASFDFAAVAGLPLKEVKSFSPKVKGISELPAIKSLDRLELAGIRVERITDVVPTAVTHLRLWDCRLISTEGLDTLVAVQHLDLGHSPVSSIPSLASLLSLRWFGLSAHNKLGNIRFVDGVDLEYFIIENMGELESLEPLGGMDSLRGLSAHRTFFPAADLSFLVNLPNLQKCLLEKKYRDQILNYQKKNECQFVFR